MRLAPLLMIPLLATAVVAAADPAELFRKGNEAYRNKQYDQAIDAYTRLVDLAPCAASHYDLGNAAFKGGRPGLARLHYEKALLHSPRDPDIRSNLEFLRSTLPSPLPVAEEDVFSRWVRSILDRVSVREAGIGFMLVTWLMLVPCAWGLATRRFTPGKPPFMLTLAVVPVWLLAMIGFGMKIYQLEALPQGVVLLPRVDVRTGPDAGETKRFELHEADKVHIAHHTTGWYRIALDTGENGWVEERAIGEIYD